ncbi:MAG: 5-(carboxyamino)imidazole ribonucleotide mutase [Clostridia bacterium]|nr:5-(carboxyamino)imidazole ribonucleotide mutase [Clostridia bacterium]
MNKQPKAAVIMGSDSDFPVVKKCIVMLKKFGIEADVNIISAHRTPDAAARFAKEAKENGIDIIIAAAGKAAHLAGVLAAHTTLPVIGIPMKSSTLDGLDSLLSVVQMPKGIPVATVAIDGADNAGILAAQILALKYEEIAPLLSEFKAHMEKEVEEKNKKIKEEAKLAE